MIYCKTLANIARCGKISGFQIQPLAIIWEVTEPPVDCLLWWFIVTTWLTRDDSSPYYQPVWGDEKGSEHCPFCIQLQDTFGNLKGVIRLNYGEKQLLQVLDNLDLLTYWSID
jgi:hypothetical protein